MSGSNYFSYSINKKTEEVTIEESGEPLTMSWEHFKDFFECATEARVAILREEKNEKEQSTNRTVQSN